MIRRPQSARVGWSGFLEKFCSVGKEIADETGSAISTGTVWTINPVSFATGTVQQKAIRDYTTTFNENWKILVRPETMSLSGV